MELESEEQGMYDNFCVSDSIKSLANGNGITKDEIENVYKLYHELINNRSISSEKKAQAFYDLLF